MTAVVLLTVRQVADATGLGQAKIRKEINAGRLPAKRIGVDIRVRPVDLDEWIDRSDDVAV